jgi:hypothetical protein
VDEEEEVAQAEKSVEGDDFFGNLDLNGEVLQKVEDEADVLALAKASKEIEQDAPDYEEIVGKGVEVKEIEEEEETYVGGVEAYMFRALILEFGWQDSCIKVEEMFSGVDL